MSLEAIRNGLFTHLTTCGPFAANEISTCSFDPLEHVSGSAIVFLPGRDSRIEPDRLGSFNARNYHRYWKITGALYIKDTGDPQRLLSLVWQGHDDLFSTISKDDSLNGSACGAALTRLSFDPNVAVEMGGAVWAPVEWDVIAEEL